MMQPRAQLQAQSIAQRIVAYALRPALVTLSSPPGPGLSLGGCASLPRRWRSPRLPSFGLPASTQHAAGHRRQRGRACAEPRLHHGRAGPSPHPSLAFDARLSLIREARASIDLQVYPGRRHRGPPGAARLARRRAAWCAGAAAGRRPLHRGHGAAAERSDGAPKVPRCASSIHLLRRLSSLAGLIAASLSISVESTTACTTSCSSPTG